MKAETGQLRHQVELGRPGVAEEDGTNGDPFARESNNARGDTLVDRIVDAGVDPDIVRTGPDCSKRSAVLEAAGVRHEALEAEESARFENCGDPLEAGDLSCLAREGEQCVEDT